MKIILHTEVIYFHKYTIFQGINVKIQKSG